MVNKVPSVKSVSVRGPCEKLSAKKRTINVGANIEQRPWKATVRRKQVGAEPIHGRPSYNALPPYLGSHVVDSKKRSAPAYSIGLGRKSHKLGVSGDSPANYDISGLSYKGRKIAPAYTLRSRKEAMKQFQAPAPNMYVIDKAIKASIKTIPKYSFGKKPIVLKSMPTPAPNVYFLPPVLGTAKEGKIQAAPAFSILGRAKGRVVPKVIFPGPGDYENQYRYAQKISPRYSLHTKHKVISDDHMKPGPAAHCPEKFYKHKSVPAPSFAIKHSPYLGIRKACLMQESKSSTKWECIN